MLILRSRFFFCKPTKNPFRTNRYLWTFQKFISKTQTQESIQVFGQALPSYNLFMVEKKTSGFSNESVVFHQRLLEPSNELFRCYGSTSVSVSPSKPTGLFVWNSIGLGNQKKSPEVILQLPRGFVDLDFWDFGWKTKTRLSWLWCLCVMCSRVNPRCCDSHPWFRRDSLPPPLWCQEDLEVSKLVKQPFKRLVLKH